MSLVTIALQDIIDNRQKALDVHQARLKECEEGLALCTLDYWTTSERHPPELEAKFKVWSMGIDVSAGSAQEDEAELTALKGLRQMMEL